MHHKENLSKKKNKKLMNTERNKSAEKVLSAFESCQIINPKVQNKFDYFYKPYKCNQMQNVYVPVQFDESDGITKTVPRVNKWKKISNVILKQNIEFLRESCRVINPNMYSKLNLIGKEIILNDFGLKSSIKKSIPLQNKENNKKELDDTLIHKQIFYENLENMYNISLSKGKSRRFSIYFDTNRMPSHHRVINPLIEIMRKKKN